MASLPVVHIHQKKHREKLQLVFQFAYNEDLIALVKTIPGARWSQRLKSWYVLDSEKHLALVKRTFNGKAKLDLRLLKAKRPFVRELHDGQRELLNDFYKFLKGKRYSKSTIDTYTNFVADFVSFYREKPLKDLNNRAVEVFIEEVFIDRRYSISTQRQFISALKLFVVFCPDTQINDLQLERPKKSKKLPRVLSQEEVLRLIQCTPNLKHRAILALIYSCGLRISELIALRLTDFYVERKQLIIRNAKGRKDRYVSLADSFLPLLSNYYQTYRPKIYFVEGQGGGPYAAESVRHFLRRSCKRAKLGKRVTPHTLRHSYATHLLENGVDIRYIQSLLGHAKPETTMIYTHVARKDLMEIPNPLDAAVKKLQEHGNDKEKLVLSGGL